MSTPVLQASDLEQRLIRQKDWVPCKSAFIDTKTPGSDKKDNYSFVGVGVSQNSEQHVNVKIPHGYQLGAAGMPQGVSNSLHLHFTAEVFINFGGEFNLRWGARGEQGDYVSTDGDLISVPTWIFRGFTNIGPDDGILYTVLGRDDTGGIIWGPQVLREAESLGLYLSRANQLIDTTEGAPTPSDEERIAPLTEQQLAELDVFSPEQFRTRVVKKEDRQYSNRGLLCNVLPGGRARLALAIGYGLSEDRRQVPNIHEPHGFGAAWINASAGEGVLAHSLPTVQTLTCTQGRVRVTLNQGAEAISVELDVRDTLSIPAGVVRSFEAIEDADVLSVTAGDGRVEIDWVPEVLAAAEDSGYALDPNHYLAPVSFLRAAGLK